MCTIVSLKRAGSISVCMNRSMKNEEKNRIYIRLDRTIENSNEYC